MIEVHVPLASDEVEFEAERMLGDAPGRIASRVSLAVGSAPPVQDGSKAWDALEPSMKASLDAFDFRVVSIVCTLLEKRDEIIQRAELAVGLVTDRDSASTWSMAPQKGYRDAPPSPHYKLEVGLSANLLVSPSLKFAKDWTPPPGVEPWLIGVGEGQADPEWTFKRVGNHSLSDDHHLCLVVRSPKGAQLKVSCEFDAWISRPGAGQFLARARRKSAETESAYEIDVPL